EAPGRPPHRDRGDERRARRTGRGRLRPRLRRAPPQAPDPAQAPEPPRDAAPGRQVPGRRPGQGDEVKEGRRVRVRQALTKSTVDFVRGGLELVFGELDVEGGGV